MNRRNFLAIAVVGTPLVSHAPRDDSDLARLLADPHSRASAIKQIVSSQRELIPLLVQWTAVPPVDVKRSHLFVGLAEAFGELRAREGIPFLVANIALQREVNMPWTTKAPAVVLERLPAVKALLQIGSDATLALIKRYNEEPNSEHRLALLFTVSQMRDPRAKVFLTEKVAVAAWELRHSEEGLRRLMEARQ